jgi:hypothetical protein
MGCTGDNETAPDAFRLVVSESQHLPFRHMEHIGFFRKVKLSIALEIRNVGAEYNLASIV